MAHYSNTPVHNTMTTFYCPNCWSEVPETATVCPHCHADILERITQADYADKLIAALRHKEPMTPLRAAWILGERREQKAAPALAKIVRKAKDAFLVENAVEALGKIGGRAASDAIRAATQHSSLRVRVKARDVLKQLASRNASSTDQLAS
jgi:HEAT repeat protein